MLPRWREVLRYLETFGSSSYGELLPLLFGLLLLLGGRRPSSSSEGRELEEGPRVSFRLVVGELMG